MYLKQQLTDAKMPFIIPVADDTEKRKLEDVVQRILNNELVICVDGIEPTMFKSIKTEVPFLVDKLQDYEKTLENALLTYLGVNNCNTVKQEQLQLAEINGNNEEINLSDNDFDNNLGSFCDRVQETFGVSIDIGLSQPDVEFEGEIHENEEKNRTKRV